MPETPDTLSVDVFKVLFESAPGLYLVLDPQLRLRAVTDAYLNATMTVREEVIGRHLFDVFPDNPDDPDATGTANLRASLERVIASRMPDTMAVQQYDVERSDGSGFETRFWSPRNNPVLGPDGQVRYIIHQVEDVSEFVALQQHGDSAQQETDELREHTERMQAEILRRSHELHEANRALHEANGALRAADDAKNQFLSRVSHELRTPLNAILGFSELLTLSELEEGYRAWAGMIHSAGSHLLALLDDVLDIARIEGGNLNLAVEPVPIRALLVEVLDLVGPIADAADIRLNQAPDIPGDWCVAADRQRLRQVLMNLLSNAIKYNHPTGTVTIAVEPEPGEQFRISVIDSGRGMAPESLKVLFTPFERLDAAKAGFQGTGLGLSLSRHLTTSMAGRLEVSSELGEGSTFGVVLPLAVAIPGDHEAGEGRLVPEGTTRPAKVLYVEDVLGNIRLVEDILAHRPTITLISAERASVGLDLARQHVPDLILLDLHLPDMSGDEVFELLRADPVTSHIPVVALSADATAHHIEQLRQAGVTAYLTKPVAVRELLATLDRLLPAAPSYRESKSFR
ncbi:ATP-binding protein [Winogradskya humida]|nr:ATP-binding protein [Actinoplanes humidus]